jgi:glycosyltransferase involved in cell wall biosynthesis
MRIEPNATLWEQAPGLERRFSESFVTPSCAVECEPRSEVDRGNDPLITIGIPTRNRASMVKDCVASALAQTYRNIEVLVCDNASTDDTIESLKSIRDKRLRLVGNPVDIGMVKNFARCVEEARGDYLVLASDDNILEPGFLEKCVQLVRAEPGIPVVLSTFDILVVDEFSANQRRIVPAVTSRKLSTGIWDGTEILDQYLSGKLSAQLFSSIIRTDILRRNGYSTHPWASDEGTWLPPLLEGRAGFVNERCARYLVHGSSQSAAVSADARLTDLCEVMDEIAAMAAHKLSDPRKRARIQRLTSRYVAHQAMITLVLYRRGGASVMDVARKLRDWRSLLRRCSVGDFLATARLRSLGRILLPTPLVRLSMALGLDKYL